MQSRGIRYGYHTRNGEFAVHDGRTLFDILVKETDQQLEEAYTIFDPAKEMGMLMQLMKKQTIIGEGAINLKKILLSI